MSTGELFEDRDLTLQLHGMLSDIDPARWRDERAKGLRLKLQDLSKRMANRQRLEPLREALATEVPQLPTELDVKSRWLAFKQRIQPAYARVAESLRAEEVHVPSLRPTNYARSLFHLVTALGAVAAIQVLPHAWLVGLATVWASFAWSCEVARRLSPRINTLLMKAFSKVAHQHETIRINSATWYATALVALAVFGSPAVCMVGVMVLGVGDPMAALIGRTFGRIKLLHGRSLEGSLAFVVSGAASSLVILRLLQPGLSLVQMVAAAVGGALAGAIAELVSLRVDDNLSIPICSALGAAAMLALF